MNVAEQQQRPVLQERSRAQFCSQPATARHAVPNREQSGWAEVCQGLSHYRKASHSPYLAQKPRVILGESCPVSDWSDSGILETVLDGRGCADILIQELLPRLLRDGFGWHGYLVWIERGEEKKKQSGTESSSYRRLPITKLNARPKWIQSWGCVSPSQIRLENSPDKQELFVLLKISTPFHCPEHYFSPALPAGKGIMLAACPSHHCVFTKPASSEHPPHV